MPHAHAHAPTAAAASGRPAVCAITLARRLLLLLMALLFAAPLAAQSPVPLAQPDLKLKRAATVQAMARQPDGAVVIAGSFTSINGVPRRYLARVRADGSVDPDWNPDPDAPVTTLARAPDGAVYAAGYFSSIGGAARNGMAKLSGTGVGAAMAGWTAPFTGDNVFALATDGGGALYVGGTMTTPDGLKNLVKLAALDGSLDPAWAGADDPSDPVFSLAVHEPSNSLFVGGNFASLGAASRSNLARVALASGRVDTAWQADTNGLVTQLLVDGSAIHVAGNFDRIGGVDRSGVARVAMATGSVDLAFDALDNAGVQAMARGEHGALYVAGAFESIGGLARSGLAKLSPTTGEVDPDWAPSVKVNPEQVLALARLGSAGDALLAGGHFTRAGGMQRLGLARIDATGAVADRLDAELPGRVFALGEQPDGGIVVGGQFLTADGLPRSNLLRLRPDGGLDTAWSADARADSPFLDGRVLAIAVDRRDGTTFVGGQFDRINGAAHPYLAKLAPGSGDPDPTWIPAPDHYVNALTLDPNFRLYAGGLFGNIGGQTRKQIARFWSSGELDPWAAEANMSVFALALDGRGSIVLGGDFRLLRFSVTDGSLDLSWAPNTIGRVSALAVNRAGDLYVGGNFVAIGGEPRQSIAKFAQADAGAVDPVWNPGSEAGSEVTTLDIDADGGVLVGGDFGEMGGQTRSHLARLAGDGSGDADPDFDPQPDARLHAVKVVGRDLVAAGGEFGEIGARARDSIALLAAPRTVVVTPLGLAPAVVDAPYSQTVSATGGVEPYRFSLGGVLPDGLSLDADSGVISGTPVSAGIFNFDITATDSSLPAAGGPFTGTRSYRVAAKAAQTITFGANPGPLVFGGADGIVSASASSAMLPVFGTTTPAVCSVATDTGVDGEARVTPLAAGDCIVTADEAGNDIYFPAPRATQTVVVARAAQPALTVTATPARLVVGENSAIAASGGAGSGAITFALTSGAAACTLAGNTVSAIGVGACRITATRAGDANHLPESGFVDIDVEAADADQVFADGFEG